MGVGTGVGARGGVGAGGGGGGEGGRSDGKMGWWGRILKSSME